MVVSESARAFADEVYKLMEAEEQAVFQAQDNVVHPASVPGVGRGKHLTAPSWMTNYRS